MERKHRVRPGFHKKPPEYIIKTPVQIGEPILVQDFQEVPIPDGAKSVQFEYYGSRYGNDTEYFLKFFKEPAGRQNTNYDAELEQYRAEQREYEIALKEWEIEEKAEIAENKRQKAIKEMKKIIAEYPEDAKALINK